MNEELVPGFAEPFALEKQEPDVPYWDAFKSGFQLENDVLNAWEYLSQDRFKENPDYDLVNDLNESGLWDYRSTFMGTRSSEEFAYRRMKLQEEQQRRRDHLMGGWPGFFGAVAGGFVSPTLLIPLVGAGAKGATAAKQGLMYATTAGVLQEIPLQLNQTERTAFESVSSVAAQAVVGGVLGGLVGLLRKGQLEEIAEQLGRDADMAILPDQEAISRLGREVDLRPEDEFSGELDVFHGFNDRPKIFSRELTDDELAAALQEYNERAAGFGDPPVGLDNIDFRNSLKNGYHIPEGVFVPDPNWVKKFEKDYNNEANRYGNSIFGDYNTVYFDGDGKWVNNEWERMYFKEAIAAKVLFDRALVITDKNFERVLNRVTKETGDATDNKIAEWAKKNGYDGLIISGMNKLTKDVSEEAATKITGDLMAKFKNDGGILQDQVVSFDPAKARTVGEPFSTKGRKVVGTVAGRVERVEPFAATPADLRPSPAGAAVTFQRTGGVKKSWATKPLDRAIAQMPVVRVIEQPGVPEQFKLYRAREIMQQLSNAGLRMEDNVKGIAVAPDGVVEVTARQHMARLWALQPKIDDIYWQYVSGTNAKKPVFGNFRAEMGAKKSGKLVRHQFHERVTLAIWGGYSDEIPEVNKAAQLYSKEIFDPELKEAVEVGIYKEVPDVVADKLYASRWYIPQQVRANQIELIDDLAEHYAKDLEQRFFESAEKFKDSQAKGAQFEEDVALPFDQAQALRELFLDQIKEAELKRSPEIVASEDQIVSLKERITELREKKREWKPDPLAKDRENPFDAEIKSLREQVKAHEEMLPQESRDFQKMRADTRRRINNLNKSFALQADKAAGKMARLDRLEETNISNLGRLTRSVRRVYNNIDLLDDRVLDKQLTKLKNEFARVGGTYDKVEAKLLDEPDFQKSMSLDEVQEARREKLSELAEDIGTKEALDREFARDWLATLIQQLETKSARVVQRRGMRMQRLVDEIAALDSKLVKERIDKVVGKNKARKEAFMEKWRENGLDDVVGALESGKGDFRAFAKSEAEEVVRVLAKQTVRLPHHEIIVGKRGPERARMLTIPSDKIGYVLEKDIDKLAKRYLRTMGPDIEIARRFGDINATRWLSTDKENLGYLAQEYSDRLEQIRTMVDKKGNPLSEEAKQQAQIELADHYRAMRERIDAVLARIRHLRGIPDDPDSFGARAGKTVLDLNVTRLMGVASINSFSDLSNPIYKHTLTRVFRDGFVQLITNFKNFKMTAREAYLANEATDVISHSRASAMFDTYDEFSDRATMFERGMGALANRMGLIAGYDYWTSAMKQFAAVLTIAKLMDSMKLVMENVGTAAQRAEAAEYLASLNIDASNMDIVWKEVLAVNGGNKVNGIWWPNTEAWTNERAKRIFRQALSNEVSDTIVTPGVERPLTMDKNLPWKMVFQLKSFALSSTSKTLYAGLQQPDMALVNSKLVSLALGALSYYTWAVATGGDALDEANKLDPGKWADEAIARSGVLAVGQDAWELSQRLPGLAPYTTISGERTNRMQAQGLFEMLGGPSVDLALNAGGVILDLDEPTQSTIHKLRLMLPFQNLAFFRQALDRIEESVPVPERRN